MSSWLCLIIVAAPIMPAPAPYIPSPDGFSAPLNDAELATNSGKFLLPNGVELALAVTSDTVVNGQLILRTVLTVDHTSQIQVFGRVAGTAGATYYPTGTGPAVGVTPTGIAVTFDRQSGIQAVTPTYAVTSTGAPSVTVGAAATPAAAGLTMLALTPGGASVATADGTVALQAVRNGSQVTLAGDQFAVANLVGQSIATAVVNSANNRTLDTVTNVAIDLRNVTPIQLGSAQLRIDTMAADVARRLVR